MHAVQVGSAEHTVARRRFIGSAVSLGAGAVIGTTLSSPSSAITAAPGGGRDGVYGELVRQMKDGVRALRGPRAGEAARRLAATARLLAAHQRDGGDAELQRRLQAAVKRDGREALLRAEADPGMLAAEAREFGFTQTPAAEPFDRRVRERALDMMLTQGASPALLAAADAFERLAPVLERGGVTAVAARETDACPNLTAQLLALEFIALTSCVLSPILCAGFSGLYFGLKLSLYLAGC